MPNCNSFFLTGAERKHVRRRERLQQHRDASCHQVPLPRNVWRRRKFVIFKYLFCYPSLWLFRSRPLANNRRFTTRAHSHSSLAYNATVSQDACRLRVNITRRQPDEFLTLNCWLVSRLICLFVCFRRNIPPLGHGLLIHEVSRSHTTTHHSR